jgi:hypothetical protein
MDKYLKIKTWIQLIIFFIVFILIIVGVVPYKYPLFIKLLCVFGEMCLGGMLILDSKYLLNKKDNK